MITAKLKRLSSTDVPSLEAFRPTGDFGIYAFAFIGPAGSIGEESFGITICTLGWFDAKMRDRVMSGRHYIFVKEYSYTSIVDYLARYCSGCTGNSWSDVAQKIAQIGHWEFENYKPY